MSDSHLGLKNDEMKPWHNKVVTGATASDQQLATVAPQVHHPPRCFPERDQHLGLPQLMPLLVYVSVAAHFVSLFLRPMSNGDLVLQLVGWPSPESTLCMPLTSICALQHPAIIQSYQLLPIHHALLQSHLQTFMCVCV